MRAVMTVSSSKYTGAAAVAELWCRALRSAGHEACLLHVGGDNLERRLDGESWSRPYLFKERRPSHIRSNLAVLRSFAESADSVVTFLPHDHFEAVIAGAHRRSCLVRAFRRPRHFRKDPLHRWFAHRASAAIAPFAGLLDEARRYMGGRPVAAFEVPVEERFSPEAVATSIRQELQHFDGRPVVGMVGKLAAGRGFDLLIEAASKLPPEVCLLIVGHGEYQPALEQQARRLGLNGRVHWAGKRETDLPALYRAMNVVVFAAPGSDWGHRTISEAQACGRVVVATDHRGVGDLIRHAQNGFIAGAEPSALAQAIHYVLDHRDAAREIERGAELITTERQLEPTGRRLGSFLQGLTGAFP